MLQKTRMQHVFFCLPCLQIHKHNTSRHLHTHSHDQPHTCTLTRQWRQAGVWSRKPSGWRKWRSPPSSLPLTLLINITKAYLGNSHHKVTSCPAFSELSEYLKIDFSFPPPVWHRWMRSRQRFSAKTWFTGCCAQSWRAAVAGNWSLSRGCSLVLLSSGDRVYIEGKDCLLQWTIHCLDSCSTIGNLICQLGKLGTCRSDRWWSRTRGKCCGFTRFVAFVIKNKKRKRGFFILNFTIKSCVHDEQTRRLNKWLSGYSQCQIK